MFRVVASLYRAFVLALVLAFITAPLTPTSHAQDASSGANAASSDSAAVQAVYERMTLAYELLDVDAAANLYAEDACYVLPDSDRKVVEGRENIREIFVSFFEAARMRQAEISIEFRFVRRSVHGEVAHDVGYYRVTGRREGDPVSTSTGKFATVLRRADDGTWRFITDAYSPAPDSAFDALDPVPSTLQP